MSTQKHLSLLVMLLASGCGVRQLSLPAAHVVTLIEVELNITLPILAFNEAQVEVIVRNKSKNDVGIGYSNWVNDVSLVQELNYIKPVNINRQGKDSRPEFFLTLEFRTDPYTRTASSSLINEEPPKNRIKNLAARCDFAYTLKIPAAVLPKGSVEVRIVGRDIDGNISVLHDWSMLEVQSSQEWIEFLETPFAKLLNAGRRKEIRGTLVLSRNLQLLPLCGMRQHATLCDTDPAE